MLKAYLQHMQLTRCCTIITTATHMQQSIHELPTTHIS